VKVPAYWHNFGTLLLANLVAYEQMFGTAEGTIDQALERAGEACRGELGEISEHEARDKQRVLELVRGAIDRDDPKRAGYSTPSAWFAHVYRCDYRAALRIVETAEALRELPVLEEALGEGELTLGQVAAAAPIATPESDAEITRIAIGKAPSQIAREARRIVPPKVADDQELYRRRALRMTWTNGGRELAFSGQLPLEQGAAFEQVIRELAKQQRAEDKKHGTTLEWQQSTADALVTLARQSGNGGEGVKRSPTTLIVHLSPDEPPMLEGAGPISHETAARLTCDARRLTIKLDGSDLKHSRVTRCASYPQRRALSKRSGGQCQYPGCTARRDLNAHHMVQDAHGGPAVLANLILLCSRHHALLHDHHIRATGNAEQPVFEDQSGRVITAHQPHAPPS
jgi:HNH endonuclease